MQIYSQTDVTAHASTNGYVSILTGSSQYQTGALPNSHIPNNTVLPYGSDLYLYGGAYPPQGIFYHANSSGITFEYYLGRYQGSGIYHFTVAYATAKPGVYVYTYYNVGGSSDEGVLGVVGTQGMAASGSEQADTYASGSNSILPGLIVTCNTNLNTCVTTQPGGLPPGGKT